MDVIGTAPRKADVTITNGMIAAAGGIDGKGQEELDATVLIVTPGFVDMHTDYDGHPLAGANGLAGAIAARTVLKKGFG